MESLSHTGICTMPFKDFSNRRKTTRESAKGFVTISDPFANLLVKGVIVDLSLSGVGVRTTSPELDQYVDSTVFMLQFSIPSWRSSIDCFATIDRLVPLSGGKLIGMQFVSIGDESQMLIGRHTR